MLILAIDLGKTKSLACWYQADDATTHEFRTVPTRPGDFHSLLLDRRVDRVVIEVCDAAGWVVDLCRTLAIPVQVADTNREAWRWRNVKHKCDRGDAVTRFARDIEVGLRLDEHSDAGTEQRLVIDQRDTDGAHASLTDRAGMCADRRNFPSSPASARRMPPASCARSRMPGMP